jgi:hypothetical protein
MSQPMEWVGTARGRITDYGVKEFESGSVAISLVVHVSEYWDSESAQWTSCESDDFETTADIIIVKKDGTPNAGQVEALCRYANWNGDICAVAEKRWEPCPISFVIDAETYKNVTRYKINWIHPFDRQPGSVGNCSPEKARALSDRFGSAFRAISGNVQRNAAPPAGKPPVPPVKKSGPKPVAPGDGPQVPRTPSGDVAGVSGPQRTAGNNATETDDGIPFAWLLPLAMAAATFGGFC